MIRRGRLVAAFAVAVTGCGRIAFDARTDASAVEDAETCTFGPFGAPVHQPALGSAMVDWGPVFSPDGLELVFASDRPGSIGAQDLYLATRATRSDSFGSIVHLAQLNSSAPESSPVFSDDGLTLYFTSNRGATAELYRATRASTTAPFTPPVLVPELAGVAVTGAELSADGTELYYDYPILQRRLFDGTMFGAPSPVSELPDPAGYPSLSRDGLTMFLLAQVATPGFGEIHVATRSALDQPWGAVTRVEPLAGHGDDPSLSRDGRELVFTSVRLGEHELFIATRECL